MAVVVVALGAWAVLIEPGWVVTRESRLSIPRWPAAIGPLRIVALSDLHTGAPHVTVAKLDEIVARVNAARPDPVPIETRGGPLWIAGVSDLYTRPADVGRALAAMPEGAPMIVLTHNPDVFVRVPARVLLTLAGHTHGGQVNLPIVGRLIVPSEYGERFAIAHVREDGRDLFVTAGIGTSILPVRFGVPPEISVLTVDR